MRGGAVISESLARGHVAKPCPPALRPYVLAVAVLGSSLGFIDGTVITVVAQPIREATGASFAATMWVVNAYTLAMSSFLLVGGAAGDRFGKRRVFGAGILVFAVSSALCGLAPSVEALIAARTVQGLGAAMMVPGSLALIAVNFPAEERGRAVGTWAAASGVTSALGPVIGGALVDVGSWRLVFLINLPIATLALLLLWAKVPADPPGRGRFDLTGGLLAFLGVGGITLGFTLAEQEGFGLGPLGAIVLGTLFVAAFIIAQARGAAPMMPLDLFASRTFSVANAATLLLYFALGGIMFFLPVTVMEAHAWSGARAGAVFLPFALAMSATAPVAGRLVDRIGARTLLVASPLVAAVAFAALGPAAESGAFWTRIVPVMLLFGFGMGLAIPPLSAVILTDAGGGRSGIASAVNNAVARVAGLLAVAILGLAASVLYRSATGASSGFAGAADVAPAVRSAAILDTFAMLTLVAAVLAAAAAALALTLPRRAEPAPP
jgi:EmrB/QacA subfamily drug resistance transporter